MTRQAQEEITPQAQATCEELVKIWDRDRWLACLLAPRAARAGLFALYAFSVEIARVRETVSQPSLGEIRLQWWREVLEGARPGEAAAHPVASALRATIAAYRLPTQPFLALIEARVFDLYDDPVPTLGFLEGYAGETASALFRLASLIVAQGRDPGGASAAGRAGVAYAVTGLLRALPWHAAQGRSMIPADLLARHGASPADIRAGQATPAVLAALAELRLLARARLNEAHQDIGEMEKSARVALAPAALAPLFLKQMERADYAPFSDVIDAPQWRKQWALWRGF
jgi:phytoene synthase